MRASAWQAVYRICLAAILLNSYGFTAFPMAMTCGKKGEISMQYRLGRVSQLTLSLVLLIVVLSSAGCIGLTANLIKAWSGMVVDAEFDQLIDKRVAVVCLSDTASFGPGPIGDELAVEVAYLLKTNIDGIDVVHQQEIDDWKDENDWDQIDFREIGRGVEADMAIAINLHALSLRDGATMFRGQSEAEVVVYDMEADGESVFRRTFTRLTYPVNGIVTTTDMNDRQFRRVYVDFIAREIAKVFYAYDVTEDFAKDPAAITW